MSKENKTKEEVLWSFPQGESEPYGHAPINRIYEAMDQWAEIKSRERAIAFEKWNGENYDYNEFEYSWGKFWEIDEGVNQGFTPIPASERYYLFDKQQTEGK